MFVLFLMLLSITVPLPAFAAEPIRDERLLWSDGTTREVWTYQESVTPDTLILKESFWKDGGRGLVESDERVEPRRQ